MSNDLTALAPILYSAARIIPQELSGMQSAVRMDFDDKGVAQGQTVTVPVQPILTSGNTTPAQTFTAGTSLTAGSKILTLNNAKEVSWNYTGEEERGLENGGTQADVFRQTVEQGIRTLRNLIETSIWTTARANASRAYGTAGTAPFASDLTPATNVLKILLDNGVQPGDLSLVVNTAASLNLRNLTSLQKVNEAGSENLLRRGVIGDLHGFAIRESAAPIAVTAGTGTNYVNDGALAVGVTSIPIDVGSGTVLAGDVVTFTGDTNKYVVKTGVTAPGTIVIQEPGLKIALSDDTAMTIGAAATSNIALARNAVCAVIRPALQPTGGAVESMTITDPVTGFSFLMTRAVGKLLTSYYMNVVYDSFAPNSFGIAQLLG